MGSTNAKVLQVLHKAVTEDDPDKVREILKLYDLDVNCRGEEEMSALQLAIANGSLKSLQVILESGHADLDTLTSERQTPLMLAAAKGHEAVALFLLENFSENLLHLQFIDSHDQQVLHCASAQGLDQLVTQLLLKGLGVDTLGGKLRHTPLMLAAQNGHDSVMKVLLEAGAQKSALDQTKMTPLHHACIHASRANEACVRLLLGEKPSAAVGNEVEERHDWLNARDISGCTPLLYCLNNKNRVLEKLLVSHGAILTEALDGGFSEYCYHTSN